MPTTTLHPSTHTSLSRDDDTLLLEQHLLMKKISDYMINDHLYLEQLWSSFLNESECDVAKLHFKTFSEHFITHITMEDEVLFPLFNEMLGFQEEIITTQVARHSHDTLLTMLSTISGYLEEHDMRRVVRMAFHFQRALIKHQERENKTQYRVLGTYTSKYFKDWHTAVMGTYVTKAQPKDTTVSVYIPRS